MLGDVRVTNYTWHEGGRLTASGYMLKDSDDHLVCAVSRDLWKHRVKPGDKIWVPGVTQPCTVLDTMALRNHRGLLQTRWVDVYVNDRTAALDFGIQHHIAYLLSI